MLYEFATYIGNDMIQPGMLSVVEEFGVGNEWVPTSMTAYLAGGMFLQWLLGPLSDRIGRRPVMLTGVVWFIVTCLATLLAQTIEQFTLLRFLQGISLCFIGAVGYAAIQESFEEAVCIKITALMANVALIAPLLGPLVGAAWVHLLPWEMLLRRLASQQILFLLYTLCTISLLPLAKPSQVLALSDWQLACLVFCGLNTLVGYGALAEAMARWQAAQPNTVREASRLKCWKIMPIWRRARVSSFSDSAVSSWPPTCTLPCVGRSSRLTQRINVLLPAPEAPMTP